MGEAGELRKHAASQLNRLRQNTRVANNAPLTATLPFIERTPSGWNSSAERNLLSSLGALGPSVDFRPPPSDADEQKSPVTEKLGRFAFKRMAYELENPPNGEQHHSVNPQPMEENTDEKYRKGDED
jgi:hypothetical protein